MKCYSAHFRTQLNVSVIPKAVIESALQIRIYSYCDGTNIVCSYSVYASKIPAKSCNEICKNFSKPSEIKAMNRIVFLHHLLKEIMYLPNVLRFKLMRNFKLNHF